MGVLRIPFIRILGLMVEWINSVYRQNGSEANTGALFLAYVALFSSQHACSHMVYTAYPKKRMSSKATPSCPMGTTLAGTCDRIYHRVLDRSDVHPTATILWQPQSARRASMM